MATDQKFSKLESEEREQVVDYVEGRWSQNYSVARDTRKDAAKLIALMNAGGAAAVLAFIGAITKQQSGLAQPTPLKVTIALFVLGVVSSAIALVVEYVRLSGLFAKWRTDVNKLYADEVVFDKMQRDDVERSGQTEIASGFFVWGALICFALGAAVGIFLLFQGG